MKILITYYSETGNTEKVAKSIAEDLLENPPIKKIEDVDANSLVDYDVIFFGTPVHGNSLPSAAKKFLKACPENLEGPFAIFCTHATKDKALHFNYFKAVSKILGKKNIKVVDQFDCIGENKNEQVVQMLRAAMPDKIDDMIAVAKGHPNNDDLVKAKEFGAKVVGMLTPKAKV